jgi:hypothetical protein
MYYAYISQMTGARNTIEAQLRILHSAVANVKILKAMGEGAEAMKMLRENTSEANSLIDRQQNQLKEIVTLVNLEQEDGSWNPNQLFADAVDCSLENMQTTMPDILSTLKDKDTIWATIIGLAFMMSRVEKMYEMGKNFVGEKLQGVDNVDVEQLISSAKELYFNDSPADDKELESL